MKWLSVILLALVVPGVARADDPAFTPLADVPVLAPAAQLAHTYWPDSPCVGREQVALVRAPANPVSGEDAAGYALLDGTCRLVLDLRLGELDRCRVVIHELGHLAGLDHSDDPASVMYPLLEPYPPCRTAMAEGASARLADSPPLTSRTVRDFLRVHFRKRYVTRIEVHRLNQTTFSTLVVWYVTDTLDTAVFGRVRLIRNRLDFIPD